MFSFDSKLSTLVLKIVQKTTDNFFVGNEFLFNLNLWIDKRMVFQYYITVLRKMAII